MINVGLIYEIDEKPSIDDCWIRSTCTNILNDHNQDTAAISIILANDNKLLEFMPEDYLREYFFYNYADDIQEQVLQENITNAESKMECG